MVRAKFKVVEKTIGPEAENVKLYPVVGGNAENEAFYKWTPSGHIDLATINKSASDQFEVGKEYYVDFTLAE